MDEYKEYVYERNPERWNAIDHGDVSHMLGIKKKLNCKPFKYFLEQVAPVSRGYKQIYRFRFLNIVSRTCWIAIRQLNRQRLHSVE